MEIGLENLEKNVDKNSCGHKNNKNGDNEQQKNGFNKSENQNHHNHHSASTTTVETYENFQRWIYCIAVVTFDIEIGQSIECIFPKQATLSEKETSNVCYLSFPDSNSGCMGDTQFHFRTKTCEKINRPLFERHYKSFNACCLPLLEVDPSYFYGFVYFRQVKDRNARRGYFQKSLVILTWFPFVSLFTKIIKTLAPEYFDYGLPSLEAACSDINRWPAPVTDQVLNLPLFGTLTQVLIPGEKYHTISTCQQFGGAGNGEKRSCSSAPPASTSLRNSFMKLTKRTKVTLDDSDVQEINNYESTPSPMASSILNVGNNVNIYRTLTPIIAHVQLLWELVLTNEPIAVIAQTPNVCSDVVAALVNLIAPLRYGADYRPFFTIHDSEFKEYTSHSKSPPPVILGVTNPFFVKTLQDWPHLIKINDFSTSKSDSGSNGSKKPVKIDAPVKNNSNNKSLELKTGVYTKYKPFLQKDREILKKLLKGMETNRPSEAQNAIIRRFLVELTHSFCIPLERYFASLMPLAKNLSPFKRPPKLHFKVEDFISTLDATGPHLTSLVKGDWVGLYRRFLRSPNFVGWYHSRVNEANEKIMSLHLETICDSNLANMLNDKPEVEIVDLILKLRENLKCASNGERQISADVADRIKRNMDKIIDKLPEDSRPLFGEQPISL